MSKYSVKVAARGGNPQFTPPRAAVGHTQPQQAPLLLSQNENDGPDHFCAGALFYNDKGVWHVAAVTDGRYVNESKLPGGTNSNSRWEQPIQTLLRELKEELWLDVDSGASVLVHSVNVSSTHTQHFYLVRHWTGQLRNGRTGDWFTDTDGVSMKVEWMPLKRFWQRCFQKHKDGFRKAVEAMASGNTDSSFRQQAVSAKILSTN